MRPAHERYPAAFYTETKTNAAHVGLTGDALYRLYKKDPSLGFMIQEGGRLISHPTSMQMWNEAYEERKQNVRHEKTKNGEQRGFLIVWTK
jgi:hypothetical protein